MPRSSVYSALKAEEKKNKHKGGIPRYWTAEKILAKFHEFNKLNGRPPLAEEWLLPVPLDKNGHRIWPSTGAVQAVFGSWSNGMEAAGFERRNGRRSPAAPMPRKFWTKEEIIQKIQEWQAEHGLPPAKTDWQKNDEWPSHGSVAYHFGSWSDGIRAAGFLPLPTGVTKKSLSTYLPIPRKTNT